MNLLIDNLIRIQNGINFKQKFVKLSRNKLTLEVLKLLYSNGFINGFFVSKKEPFCIFVVIKYYKNNSIIKKFKLYSKPSKHVYLSKKKLRKNVKNKGFFVISNSVKGLFISGLTEFNNNIFNLIGGKLLFKIII